MTQEEREELSIEGAGVKAGYKGRSQVMPFLLAILLGGWIWYLTNNHEAKAADTAKAQLAVMAELAKAVEKQTKAIEQQEKTQRAVIYVLSLPQEKREKLNLVRPEVLYEMQRYGQ